jgi:hypothetical protein
MKTIELTEKQLTALRIAIAEDQGWKKIHSFDRWKEGKFHSDGTIVGDKGGLTKLSIPNYPADRNAIVEAIVGRFMDDKEIDSFMVVLTQAVPIPYRSILFAVATASAQTLSLAYAKAAGLNIDLP